MASYHLSAQPVKRSEGRSVVAMAAYRAGSRLRDERRGVDVDYRRRRGVVHAEIMAPEDSAPWLLDRESLWNGVERMEARRDAQLAREINIALPHELDDAQRLSLVRRFVREQFVSLGMVADFAIHAPVAEKGDDPRNFHAHILLTLRQAGGGGLRSVKTREWNSEEMLATWRAAWAECQNEALRDRGYVARVDHRSFTARRAELLLRGGQKQAALLDRLPELHVGPKARKAGRAVPPKSRDRKVGPVRKRSEGPQRRELQYTEIDRGSRGEWNIARLAANASKFEQLASRTEKRLARMRPRLAYYERQMRRYEPPDHEVERDPPARNPEKYLHARKRHEQAAYWINELDHLFFALLGIRESQLVRRTVWSNRLKRWRPLDLAPTRGGGRERPRPRS